ncbi:unnamed protein product [Parajaminaea phylloscopi]
MTPSAGPSSSSSSKRKAPTAVTEGFAISEQAGQPGGAPSYPRPRAPVSSKRSRRLDGGADSDDNADDVDYVTGDIDLEEQDRKRNQQGRKGRVYTDGYNSSDSDSDDEDDEDDASEAGDGQGPKSNGGKVAAGVDEDEDEDMFGPAKDTEPKKGKEQSRFLALEDIEGQEFGPGGVKGKGNEEEDPELELESDSDSDDESADGSKEATATMSPGGTTVLDAQSSKSKGTKASSSDADKKAKPKTADPMDDMGYKMDGFNMKNEMASGRFDEEGNYIANAKDPHAEHDRWLEGNYSRKAIKSARDAKLKREQEERVREKEKQREGEESGGKEGLMMRMVQYMDSDETVMETLQRLGKEARPHRHVGGVKRSGAKQLRQGKRMAAAGEEGTDGVQVDAESASSGVHASVKAIEDFTDLASTLMSRYGVQDIYEEEYASLLRAVRRAGIAPSSSAEWDPAAERRRQRQREAAAEQDASYVYRWAPSYLESQGQDPGGGEQTIFGPFPRAELEAWKEAGYFGDEDADRILLLPRSSHDAEAGLPAFSPPLSEWLTWPQAFGTAS